MMEVTAHIGTLYIQLFMSEAQSLKEKRMILKRLKDQLRSRFNVSVGELDGQDKWQFAVLGITMIGHDQRYIDGVLQNVLSYIENHHDVEITDCRVEFF